MSVIGFAWLFVLEVQINCFITNELNSEQLFVAVDWEPMKPARFVLDCE